MDIRLCESTVDYSCGIEVIGHFYHESFILKKEDEWLKRVYAYDAGSTVSEWEPNNTGYFIAAFIETDVCVEAEKQLREKYKVVFESEWRENTNSNNMFKFIVFDNRA